MGDEGGVALAAALTDNSALPECKQCAFRAAPAARDRPPSEHSSSAGTARTADLAERTLNLSTSLVPSASTHRLSRWPMYRW